MKPLFNINKTKLINNKFQMNSFQDLRPLSIFNISTFYFFFSRHKSHTSRVFTHVIQSILMIVEIRTFKNSVNIVMLVLFKCQIRTKSKVLIARKHSIFYRYSLDFVPCLWMLWKEMSWLSIH